MDNWIVSYGTLVNKKITSKTGKSKRYVPCYIKDYIRRWNFRVWDEFRSAAGIEMKNGAYTTGVLVEVEDRELPKFDAREVGYERVKVEDKSVVNVIEGELPAGQFWIYKPLEPKIATAEFPITQTMVDAMIDGCLEISDEFAEQCIATTMDWDLPWINDRKNPRYPRYLEGVPVDKIDSLLKKVLPGQFGMRIES